VQLGHEHTDAARGRVECRHSRRRRGLAQRADRDDALADGDRAAVGPLHAPVFQHSRVRPDSHDYGAAEVRAVIAADGECAFHRKLVTAARDHVALHGVETFAADARAPVDDLRGEIAVDRT